MTTGALFDAQAAREDGDAPHEAACLRPFCCNPFAAFAAFSRVGGWTPGLPEAEPVDQTGNAMDDPGNA